MLWSIVALVTAVSLSGEHGCMRAAGRRALAAQLALGSIGEGGLTLAEGQQAARWCGLNLIATIQDQLSGDLDRAQQDRLWRLLDDSELAQQLNHYPPDYVTEGCAKGRIIETVERFEEDLTGKVTVHGPVEANVTVGDAIEVSTSRLARGQADPLMSAIEDQMKSMLGITASAPSPMEIS